MARVGVELATFWMTRLAPALLFTYNLFSLFSKRESIILKYDNKSVSAYMFFTYFSYGYCW